MCGLEPCEEEKVIKYVPSENQSKIEKLVRKIINEERKREHLKDITILNQHSK